MNYLNKTGLARLWSKIITKIDSVKVPTGGTTGQVLAKKSDSDNDLNWITLSGEGGVTVIDNLESESTADALSAKQGKVLNEKINGIVESGSNDNGSWIKWSDGTMIVRKTVLGTVDISSSTMSGAFYYGQVNLGSLPVSFIERPTIIVSPQTQSGTQYFLAGAPGGTYGTASTWGIVTLLRPASRTGVAYVLDAVAIGKWK